MIPPSVVKYLSGVTLYRSNGSVSLPFTDEGVSHFEAKNVSLAFNWSYKP